MYPRPTILIIFVVLAAGVSIGGTDDTDHPLVSRYPGSTIASKEVQEYDEYRLVSGLDAKGNVTGPTLEGKVTRILYQKPKERSNFEIMPKLIFGLFIQPWTIAKSKLKSTVPPATNQSMDDIGLLSLNFGWLLQVTSLPVAVSAYPVPSFQDSVIGYQYSFSGE